MNQYYKGYLIDHYENHYVIVDTKNDEVIAHVDTVKDAKEEIDEMEDEAQASSEGREMI